MINGIHALMYAKNAKKARAFFKDVLGFNNVDAGEGWLIFTMPPAELGVHPADGEPEHTELHFMCDDVVATVAELKKKGVKCAKPVDRGYGIVTSFKVPGAGSIGLYQPRHPVAYKK
jgi:catechol 2,3-dioxygenase-like lactoylglutathione lyase family enzyme